MENYKEEGFVYILALFSFVKKSALLLRADFVSIINKPIQRDSASSTVSGPPICLPLEGEGVYAQRFCG